MIQIIKHRINRLSDLAELDPAFGAEIDLRSDVNAPGRLHLSHDAWKRGDDFLEWISLYRKKKVKGPLILNTKEDGLESRILEILNENQIENYFFLDTALPTLIHWTMKKGNKNFALRVSAYEKTENMMGFIGKANWLWVDCFDGIPISTEMLDPLRGKFQFCLVSPELQMQPPELIEKFKSLKDFAGAVCTKRPDLWIK